MPVQCPTDDIGVRGPRTLFLDEAFLRRTPVGLLDAPFEIGTLARVGRGVAHAFDRRRQMRQ